MKRKVSGEVWNVWHELWKLLHFWLRKSEIASILWAAWVAGGSKFTKMQIPITIGISSMAENIFVLSSCLSPQSIGWPSVSVSVDIQNWKEVPFVTFSQQLNLRISWRQKLVDDPSGRRCCDPFICMNCWLEENSFLVFFTSNVNSNTANLSTLVRFSNWEKCDGFSIINNKRIHPPVDFIKSPIMGPIKCSFSPTWNQRLLINQTTNKLRNDKKQFENSFKLTLAGCWRLIACLS